MSQSRIPLILPALRDGVLVDISAAEYAALYTLRYITVDRAGQVSLTERGRLMAEAFAPADEVAA